MAITTTCSGCGKTLAVADEFAGRQARCPACGQIYTIPSIASPSLPSQPAAALPSEGSFPASLEPSGIERPAPLDLGTPLSVPSSSHASSPASSSPQMPGAGALDEFGNRQAAAPNLQYWMKATNGTEYGPVDSSTLARWFAEGRVGQDYMIRFGEGHWQPAPAFQSIVSGPMTMSSSGHNPFAAHSAFTPGVTTARTYPKADQSGLVLAMGILSWVGFCPIFGIIAWVIGGQALNDINAGQADPNNRGIVQVGYYLGMANCILFVGCGAFMLLGIALSAV